MNRARSRRILALSGVLLGSLLLSACGNQHSAAELAAVNGPGGSDVTVVGQGQNNGTTGASVPTSTGGTTGLLSTATSTSGTTGTTGTTAPATSGTTGGSTSSATTGSTSTSSTGSTGSSTGKRTSTGGAQGCAKQLDPITIGQVGGFTGLVSNTLAGAKVGLPVWVAATNAKGGVACHPIRLVQADDASDPSKSNAAVRDLVQNKGAIALVGSAVPISVAGFRQGVEGLKVPAVGGDSLNPDWNESPMLFPQGTTFSATIIGAAKANADKGKKKIGLVYCVEAGNCTDAYQVLKNGGAAKAGAQVVYESQISITATDYSAQCQGAKSANADQLLLAMDGSAIQRFLRSCAALQYYPAVATSAIATGSVVTEDANARKATVAVGHIVFPWMRTDTPAQLAYATAMKQYAPDTPSDGSTSQAWVSGEMFRYAVESLGAQASQTITTAMVLKGLANIKNQTFGGLTTPVTFTAGQAHAPENNCYFPVTLGSSGWASRTSRATCFT